MYINISGLSVFIKDDEKQLLLSAYSYDYILGLFFWNCPATPRQPVKATGLTAVVVNVVHDLCHISVSSQSFLPVVALSRWSHIAWPTVVLRSVTCSQNPLGPWQTIWARVWWDWHKGNYFKSLFACCNSHRQAV